MKNNALSWHSFVNLGGTGFRSRPPNVRLLLMDSTAQSRYMSRPESNSQANMLRCTDGVNPKAGLPTARLDLLGKTFSKNVWRCTFRDKQKHVPRRPPPKIQDAIINNAVGIHTPGVEVIRKRGSLKTDKIITVTMQSHSTPAKSHFLQGSGFFHRARFTGQCASKSLFGSGCLKIYFSVPN